MLSRAMLFFGSKIIKEQENRKIQRKKKCSNLITYFVICHVVLSYSHPLVNALMQAWSTSMKRGKLFIVGLPERTILRADEATPSIDCAIVTSALYGSTSLAGYVRNPCRRITILWEPSWIGFRALPLQSRPRPSWTRNDWATSRCTLPIRDAHIYCAVSQRRFSYKTAIARPNPGKPYAGTERRGR